MGSSFQEVTRLSGKNTITVVHSKRVRGHVGGKASSFIPRFGRVTVYYMSELVSIFTSIIALPFVQVGNRIVKLATIPIESFFGKAAVSAVAGWGEHTTD